MSWYLTRVELHKSDNYSVSAEDYEKLHLEMAKEGFKRKITSSENEEYQLPTAEYFNDTNNTIDEVIQAAKRAASKVVASSIRVKDYSVIVAMASQLKWYNLPKVKQTLKWS